eukprot:123230-Alexandrium_andersonii.AAC.1
MPPHERPVRWGSFPHRTPHGRPPAGRPPGPLWNGTRLRERDTHRGRGGVPMSHHPKSACRAD